MDTNELSGRSAEALVGFRVRVERLGLWNGAWISVVAIQNGEKWLAFMLRIRLAAPGVRVPTADQFFDARAADVVVRVLQVDLDECWRVADECARGAFSRLSALLGLDLHIPMEKSPGSWSYNSSLYSRKDRVQLLASRTIGSSFHDIFGWELFERLGPQLRSHEPPYGSLREIADGMGFFGGAGFDNNNATPQYEISAELPICFGRCFYNSAHQGIEIQVEAGVSVPRERLSVSVTPEPRKRLSGEDFNSTRNGSVRKLSLIVPCSEPRVDLAVNLQFDDVPIASLTIPAQAPSPDGWRKAVSSKPREEWEEELAREFHLPRRALRHRLRAVLPNGVANLAEWRIAEGIRLRREHPFLAVVCAASVAEVLVKERLAKVTRKNRVARWAEMRIADSRLAKKLPPDEVLRFDHAIRLAHQLRLLGDIDLQSLNLLRVARNEIHLTRKSRRPTEDFSPVRADLAILATLDLCRLLGSISRARARHQKPRG